MKPVQLDEILSLGAYEEVREHFRARVIEQKRLRRIQLGRDMSVVFENRDTVLLQIQEMLRTERITTEASVLHEIETYNQLIPGDNELSATIFIEYTEREERERMLMLLAGVEDKFYLNVAGQIFPVHNDTRILDPRLTSAVQYTKFLLSPTAVAQIVAGASTVTLGVKHPEYEAETRLLPATLANLALDFS